jgi:hypothetical protein
MVNLDKEFSDLFALMRKTVADKLKAGELTQDEAANLQYRIDDLHDGNDCQAWDSSYCY